MKSLNRVCRTLCGLGLLLSSSASAYTLTGEDWTYQPNPMGEDFRVCPTGMPGEAVQRTKDGAFEWNYSKFNFTFETDVCLSGGVYPKANGINQVDIGGGLGSGTLAVATWFFNPSTGDILECDIRFNNAFNWYTGTGAPASNQYDWWSVAAHEMGHCLGLGHESGITDPKPVMFPSLANGEVTRHPTPDDIAGRNAIYGGEDGISINNVTVTEGNAGVVNAVFTVSLSPASDQTVTVDFSTANGTATAGSDYVTNSGTLTFAPGETSKTVTVQVNGDTLNEPNETFFVNLSAATNAPIANSQGVGIITNDDPIPSLSINDVTVNPEGNSGTVDADFTVSLSAISGQTVTVKFVTGNGTAKSGSDYVAKSGTLTFSPGEISKTVSISVKGDTLDEANETFYVNLSSPINATLAKKKGVGTIIDDDPPPTISISDAVKTEGNTGTANAVFTVSLSAASGKTVKVNFATANGTATAGSDYVAKSGTLSFSPGQTVKTIAITIIGDTLNESNETFFVNLSNPTNATIADSQGVGTIVNND